ncbi:hypothetical protein C8R44DRAFT_883538 [Mycena epipterygia]|nr:hypothetical protein C8R44DRAFT_883538 [Mycena epipterygia]
MFACRARAPGPVVAVSNLTIERHLYAPVDDACTRPSEVIASERVRSVEILLSVVKVHNLCIFSEFFADSIHRRPAIPVHRAPSPPPPPAPPVYHLSPRDHPCSLPMPAATAHPLRILKRTSLPSLPSYCMPTASKRDHDVPFGASQLLWLPAAHVTNYTAHLTHVHDREPAFPAFSPSTGLARSPLLRSASLRRQGRTLKNPRCVTGLAIHWEIFDFLCLPLPILYPASRCPRPRAFKRP